ncbi:MAG: NAD(P)-binding domain-containing protein [Gammaproteobacteria bacterium]
MTTVGVIGTGTIAAPMVRSLLRRFNDIQIVVSPRSVDTAASLGALSSRVEIAVDNQEVLDASDTVLLCMLAEVAREILPDLTFKLSHRIVTVMIDYSVEELLTDCWPATHIELTMPLPFIETGGCPLPCYPTAKIVNELFGDDNPVTVLSENITMQSYIAVAGVVSGFIQSIDTVAGWLAEQTGHSQEAESHVLNMLLGYLQATPRDGQNRLKQVMSDLSTEGGLNAQFRQSMLESGQVEAIRNELDILLKRLNS